MIPVPITDLMVWRAERGAQLFEEFYAGGPPGPGHQEPGASEPAILASRLLPDCWQTLAAPTATSRATTSPTTTT
jgi:hypothetical protein